MSQGSFPMAFAADDLTALVKSHNLVCEALDCVSAVFIHLRACIEEKFELEHRAATRLQAAARGFLTRQRAQLLHGSKRTDCSCLHPSEVAAPLLQIGTLVAICWEPLAVIPRRDNVVGGLVLAVPLTICPKQQDVILRRGAIMGGAAPTTIRTEPPVIVLLHVGRFVRSWSWLWMAVGKFAGFPWDPGETSITPPPRIKALGLFIVLVVNKILSRDVKG